MGTNRKINIHKEHIKIFIILGLIGLTVIFVKTNKFLENIHANQPVNFGVSYSPYYSQALGLDPQTTYQKVLEELQVKNLRLSAYWDEIEPQPGIFDFSKLDYYIDEAGKHSAKVVLSVGYKLPRWPECRAPQWLDHNDSKTRQARTILMLKEVIHRYNYNPVVSAWQLENEPLFPFGLCPASDENFFKQEVALVRSLTTKPILVTDSGELSSWRETMPLGDYFGTTLYRSVRNDFTGAWQYPLKPWFYFIKSQIVRQFFAPYNNKTIIAELQAEPWSDSFITNVPLSKQLEEFPAKQLKNNVDFARKVGFGEIYLWGVEWWYWMKANNQPQYWEYAKQLF